MLASARIGQTLRQRPLYESLIRATTRRAFVKPTLIRRKPNTSPHTYSTASRPSSSTSRSWQSAYRSLFSLRFRNIRFNSSKTGNKLDPTPHLGSPEPTTIRARMKRMSKEYGWVAVGVYLGLSLLDFPLCFLAVRLAGPERIGQIEHKVLSGLKAAFAPVWDIIEPVAEPVLRNFRKEKEAVNGAGEAIEEAGAKAENHREAASIWTELALAYGIHKTLLIFVRVPLAAALTPKVAKVLRGWGWKIGRQRA